MIQDLKELLSSQTYGVLSTKSADLQPYPFGSVVLYSLSDRYQPLMYLSDLAEHTRNIKQDNHVALTVLTEGAEDPQTCPRVTLIGQAKALPDGLEYQVEYDRFFKQFPQTLAYRQLDFELYEIDVVKIRFIAGFGKMGWIEGSSLLA
jgi:putative heme iron utilization protein